MPRLVVVVHGVPGPQGSKRHVGRGVLVESSSKVAPWRDAVRAAAVEALAWDPREVVRAVDDPEVWALGPGEAVEVSAVFTLARPRSHYRTGKRASELREAAPEHPVGRPDLDKLVRSTLDALTDAGALVDDSRVVELHVVKCYPGGHLDSLDTPGAVLVLRSSP
jgi:crossover junction endodeoxyribonuclease RusA